MLREKEEMKIRFNSTGKRYIFQRSSRSSFPYQRDQNFDRVEITIQAKPIHNNWYPSVM